MSEASIPLISIRELSQYEGNKVCIRGWMYNRRGSKSILFLQMRDGTGKCQATALDEILSHDDMEICRHLPMESSLELCGTVAKHPRMEDEFELQITGINVIGQAKPDYPITPKEHGVDYLMAHRHLWLRSSKQTAILRLRAAIERALMDFFDGNGFTRVDAPILTPASVEGTGTLFETEYFGESAFLSQSGQLYMEAAAMALGKVYCFGPTFRAEKSKTRRHVAEFWMVEPEVAFLTFEENMELQEDLLLYTIKYVLENCQDDFAAIDRDTKPLEIIRKPFPRLHYRDAAKLLAEAGYDDFHWGSDLGAEHETYLSTHPQFEGQPIFLHHFPASCKAFYMQPDPEEPELTLSIDCLAPEGIGEVVGGSIRIDDIEMLYQRINEHKLPLEPLEWYLDLRRYGSVPHGGFGLGIARTVGWICGLPHLRETLPFARTMTRIYP